METKRNSVTRHGSPKWGLLLLEVLVMALLLFASRGSHAFSPTRRTHLPLAQKIRIGSPFHYEQHQKQQSTINIQLWRTRPQCQASKGLLEEDRDDDSSWVKKLAGGGDNKLEDFLLLVPAFTAWIAFVTYKDTSLAFHSTVDYLSGHNWASVDGGAYLTDLITPALTGPVASFISLLFGTLSSMTIGSLYDRQATMSHLLSELLGDLRLLQVHMKTLPTADYQQQGRKLITAYGSNLVDNLQETTSSETLGKRREAGRRLLEQLMQLLHQVAGDKSVKDQINGKGLDECYSTLNRLIQTRSSLVTTFENSFPVWHYGNLCILALSILFTFLVLTDKTALLFLGGFQLRVCWSMLIGTLSMLVVVVYDLNTPLSGSFQILRPTQLDAFDVEEFVEARQDGSGTLWMTDDW